jgi:plastocyanin
MPSFCARTESSSPERLLLSANRVYLHGVLLLRFLFALLTGGGGTLTGQVTIKRHDGSDKQDYSDVVVFIADVTEPAIGHAEIRQRGKEFVPRVLAVPAGTEVAFPNDDKVEHNVFSRSSISDFDLGRFGKGPGKSRRFDRPGVAEIFCNVHKDMVAYLVIAPSKLFALTGPDGRFAIKNIPPGRHRVQVWERFAVPRVMETSVDVPAGGSAELRLEVLEKTDADPAHKNKFGVDYSTTYH